MALAIARERANDTSEIASVVEAAFADRTVAEFVALIRSSSGYVSELTFVAKEDGDIVGYTMLSYVDVEGAGARILTLTPVAVRPDRQRQGIGTAIVHAALEAADARGEPLVLVEGILNYYPRFGFVSASALGLERPDERIPDAAWMARPLRAYDPNVRGRVVYPSFFPPPHGA